MEINVAKMHALSGNDFQFTLEALRYHRGYLPALQSHVAPDTTLSVAVRSWTYSRSLGSTSGTLEHPRDLDREVLHSKRYYTIEPTRGSYVLHQPCERYYQDHTLLCPSLSRAVYQRLPLRPRIVPWRYVWSKFATVIRRHLELDVGSFAGCFPALFEAAGREIYRLETRCCA